MHEYGGAASAIARTSRNDRVPLRGGHRIAENLRLARAMELQSGDDDLEYWVPAAWRAQRIAGTLGIHPGSMAWKGNEAKRWPYERFVALLKERSGGMRIETGEFGAMMDVELVNDGPVTLILDR